jgi:hypothetical protein
MRYQLLIFMTTAICHRTDGPRLVLRPIGPHVIHIYLDVVRLETRTVGQICEHGAIVKVGPNIQ